MTVILAICSDRIATIGYISKVIHIHVLKRYLRIQFIATLFTIIVHQWIEGKDTRLCTQIKYYAVIKMKYGLC